jgi:hypothetical protein
LGSLTLRKLIIVSKRRIVSTRALFLLRNVLGTALRWSEPDIADLYALRAMLAIGIIRDDTETLKVQFSPMRGTPSGSAVIRVLGFHVLKKGGLI